MIEFTPNPAFLEELAHDAGVRDELRARAETALAGAQAASRSRTFSERLAVEETEAGIELVCDWDLWNIIEYGTARNAPEAPLRRGVEAAGLQLIDGGRS